MQHPNPKQPEALPAPYEFWPEVAEDFASWMSEQAVADATDKGEAPWTFEAVHDPEGGKSIVKAIDEEGEFAGYWTFNPGNYRRKRAHRKLDTFAL